MQLRIHYPARYDGTDAQRLSGTLPVDSPPPDGFPVVIVVPGINVGPEAYGWLGAALAERGYAVVNWSWVDDLFGGHLGLTAGIDLDAVRPDTAGTRPACLAIAPVLDHLATLGGPLAGQLDLGRIALGGHSAGGTAALQSAATDWFDGCRAAFSYAGHTMATTALGWADGTVVPLPHDTPVLLLGGTDDGVIAGSADRYGTHGPGHDPIERTFDEAVAATGQNVLAVLAGANHFSFTHPLDPTMGRGFLEDEQPSGAEVRHLLADLVGAFCDRHVREEASASTALDTALADPLIQHTRRR